MDFSGKLPKFSPKFVSAPLRLGAVSIDLLRTALLFPQLRRLPHLNRAVAYGHGPELATWQFLSERVPRRPIFSDHIGEYLNQKNSKCQNIDPSEFPSALCDVGN